MRRTADIKAQLRFVALLVFFVFTQLYGCSAHATSKGGNGGAGGNATVTIFNSGVLSVSPVGGDGGNGGDSRSSKRSRENVAPGFIAEAPEAACDLLAAHPSDSSRPLGVPGVWLKRIDAKAAITVCRVALNKRPDDTRLTFELARAFTAEGSPTSAAEAVRLLQHAAEQAFAPAEFDLGIMYETGLGSVPKNPKKAMQLYDRAAAHGYIPAIVRKAQRKWVTLRLENGEWKEEREVPLDTKGNRDRALEQQGLLPAAESGNPVAQYAIADLYVNSIDGAIDDQASERAALPWLKNAAAQDYPPAEAILGLLYLSGEVDVGNSVEGVHLCQRASDANELFAFGCLFKAYKSGLGVAKDEAKASDAFDKFTKRLDECRGDGMPDCTLIDEL